MNKHLIRFLQGVIVMIGIGTLALLLWEPHVEGVNADAAFFEVYLDPFIALVYLGSIAFFVALYQAFVLLRLAGSHHIFSTIAVRAVKRIKQCALVIIGFVVFEEVVIILNHGSDDIAGGVAMGIFITFGSVIVATAAAVFERLLQIAVDLKEENDLTI